MEQQGKAHEMHRKATEAAAAVPKQSIVSLHTTMEKENNIERDTLIPSIARATRCNFT